MQEEIGNIAEVKPGYAFRSAIEASVEGNVFVVQARNITRGDQYINIENLVKTSYEIPTDSYLRNGDVLLVARGMKSGAFRSAVFRSDLMGVVASSSLHVVRQKTNNILPEYLSHYLNSPYGQEQLEEIVSGGYIGAISRKKLEGLRIAVPEMRKQAAIVDLYRNMAQQQKILDRRNTLKQKIINGTFKNIIST